MAALITIIVLVSVNNSVKILSFVSSFLTLYLTLICIIPDDRFYVCARSSSNYFPRIKRFSPAAADRSKSD